MPCSGAADAAGDGLADRRRPPPSGRSDGAGRERRAGGPPPVPGTALLAALVGLLGWACARPAAPPGAEEETRPPAVRSLAPALDTVVPGLSGAAKVRFVEPIEAGSGLRQELVASPAYSYTVSVGHSEISVRPEGGWRPDAVYVLQLPAGIRDLLGNQREEPVRLVFSTGPPIRPTVVRGRLFDRVTGEERTDGRFLFLSARGDSVTSAADTVPYTAVADSTGRYVLRHLPPGDYWAYGFVDQNRNRRLDRRLEPYDSARVRLPTDSSEASVNLFTLQPDSTPPRVGRIWTPDSVTVRLEFDDRLRPGHRPVGLLVHLERGGPAQQGRDIRVLTAEDTMPTPGEDGGTGAATEDTARPDAAVRDTAAGDAAGTDSAAVGARRAAAAVRAPGDSLPGLRARGRGAPAADTAAADTAAVDTPTVDKPPRPTRILEIRLAKPLTADTFRIQMQGVTNVWGLQSNVDTTFVFVPATDTAAADTAAVDGATADTAADTTVAPRDTAGAVTDTAGPPPDAVPAEDTAAGGPPPDSAAADAPAVDTSAALPGDTAAAADSAVADTSAGGR